MDKVKIAAAALLFAGAYFYYRQTQASTSPVFEDAGELLTDATQQTAEIIDQLTGGTMKLSAMANVTQADLQNANVQAFLRVIRTGEGTPDEAGYRRMFGGELLTSFADHPRRVIVKTMKSKTYRSSAAGAYQALTSTWDETKRIMGLRDFSPASQDLFGVGRIAARGALADVKAGRFTAAIKKCANEWASLPYSPYGQPVISMAKASIVYTSNGGVMTA